MYPGAHRAVTVTIVRQSFPVDVTMLGENLKHLEIFEMESDSLLEVNVTMLGEDIKYLESIWLQH